MFDPHSPPTSFELEITTRCNASCPQCSRNYYGGSTWPTLPIVDLSLSWLKEKFSKDFLSSLNMVRLVGTYGDPCMHKDLIPIVHWLHENTQAQLIISTNGSLRSRSWWRELGLTLRPQDCVMFCIDGLADTNHLYRKDTNFEKIIKNLKEFNQAGGRSIWSFIVFEHNQHQVDQAREFSKEIGCSGFGVKTTSRFIDKQHNFVDKSPVRDRQHKIIHWIKPPSDPKYVNLSLESYQENVGQYGSYLEYLKNTPIDCDSQLKSKFYVSAEGLVFPCGWLSDRLYGYEAENHPDRQKMLGIIDQCGGLESISLNYNKLEDIIYGKFFQAINQSWNNNKRLERCAVICGKNSHTLTSYKELNEILKP